MFVKWPMCLTCSGLLDTVIHLYTYQSHTATFAAIAAIAEIAAAVAAIAADSAAAIAAMAAVAAAAIMAIVAVGNRTLTNTPRFSLGGGTPQ